MGNGLNSNFHQKKQLRSDGWPTRTWSISKNTNEKDYNTKPAKRFPTRRHIDMLAANKVFHCVHQVCLHGGEHQTLGVITPDAQFKGAVVESNFVRFFESSPASGHKSPSGMQYFLKSCRSVRVSSNSRISRGPGRGASPIWNSKQIPKSFYSKKKEIALGSRPGSNWQFCIHCCFIFIFMNSGTIPPIIPRNPWAFQKQLSHEFAKLGRVVPRISWFHERHTYWKESLASMKTDNILRMSKTRSVFCYIPSSHWLSRISFFFPTHLLTPSLS